MEDLIRTCELFDHLDEAEVERLRPLARRKTLEKGEYLFLLGGSADRLYVLLDGEIDVCFPFSYQGAMRDVAVETHRPGKTLGWSALVKPYRFTLSARAASRCEVAAFLRQELLTAFEADPSLGERVYRKVAEIVGRRFLTVQALWARELQRSLASGLMRVTPIAQPPASLPAEETR